MLPSTSPISSSSSLDILPIVSDTIANLNNQIIELKKINEYNNNRIVELESNNEELNDKIKELKSLYGDRINKFKFNNIQLKNKIKDLEKNNRKSMKKDILESIFKNGNSSLSSSVRMVYYKDENYKIMSKLFYKVWRNKVIRNEILKHRDLHSSIASSNEQLFNHPCRDYIVELEYRGTDLLKAGAVPSTVKRLAITSAIVQVGSIPNGVKEIGFGTNFSSPLGPNMIPKSTRSIAFSYPGEYYCPLVLGTFNEGLCEINLGSYNHPILPGLFPSTLKTLICERFDHPLQPGTLPSSLKTLIFRLYTHPLQPGLLPSSLEYIDFGLYFNHPIQLGTFNEGLREITFSDSFNQVIAVGSIPSTVQKIVFNNAQLDQIPSYDAVSHVKEIILSPNHKKPITDIRLYSKIKYQMRTYNSSFEYHSIISTNGFKLRKNLNSLIFNN